MIKNNDEEKENAKSIYQCLNLRHLVFNSVFMTFTYLIHNMNNENSITIKKIVASVKEERIHGTVRDAKRYIR